LTTTLSGVTHILETVWFILWGVIWGAYFVLDGFDLGVGILMPFLSRDEASRRAMFNAIGPFWDGNEVWLVAAGGVTFAAFPGTYAVLFSALYAPLMLILFALILRGAALGLRSELEGAKSRAFWDRVFAISSFIPALLLGVTFANLFQGIPIDARGILHGTVLTLLNPYGLLGGFLFLVVFSLHGALWLCVKCDGALGERAALAARILWVATAVFAVVFLLFTAFTTRLYDIYLHIPPLGAIPILSLLSLTASGVAIGIGTWKAAWYFTGVTTLTIVLFGVIGMYPNLIISSINPEFSRTIANSSSSLLTLRIMLTVASIFIPLVIIYQAWVYRIFRGKVTGENPSYEGLY